MVKIQFYLCCLGLLYLLAAGTPDPALAQRPLFEQLKKTIILDPGHGGADTGARGAAGNLEKDITYNFSKAMERRLETDYKVILTRTGDYDQDLTSRTETANRADGDMLISVHTGGNYIHETKGIIIYYYDPGDGAIQNEPGQGSSKRGTPWNASQNKYSEISKGLAMSLKHQLMQNPNFTDIRVEGLPVYLLAGADMPAVLIELDYVTNPLAENKLNNTGYLSDFSIELCRGIDNYFQAYIPSKD